MLLSFLILPLWLACLVVSLNQWPSASNRTRLFGRRLAYASTAVFLGTTLGGLAGGLFVRIVCGSGETDYGCMHAGIFYGLLGSVGGLIAGAFVAASHERKIGKEGSAD